MWHTIAISEALWKRLQRHAKGRVFRYDSSQKTKDGLIAFLVSDEVYRLIGHNPEKAITALLNSKEN